MLEVIHGYSVVQALKLNDHVLVELNGICCKHVNRYLSRRNQSQYANAAMNIYILIAVISRLQCCSPNDALLAVFDSFFDPRAGNLNRKEISCGLVSRFQALTGESNNNPNGIN